MLLYEAVLDTFMEGWGGAWAWFWGKGYSVVNSLIRIDWPSE
jgi:hypothetical protein